MHQNGILLFAHGARDAAWARPFDAAADILRTRALAEGSLVAIAYLEFMHPTLPEAGADLIRQGCTHITVVPLFLGAGGHVRKDVPRLLADLATQYPQVTVRLSPAVGETDILIQALSDAAWSLAHSS